MDLHALPADAALHACESSRDGLTGDEAARRLKIHGPNALPKPARRGPLARLLGQFANPLVIVLVVAALVTLLIDHLLDSTVIAGVIVINAIVGFVQEGKAERALDAISGLLSLRARVLRDGHRQEVDASTLVPGDIVLLRSGDRVPADLRLIEVHNLRIDESALTGESVAVSKQTEPVPADAALGDRKSAAFAGTLVQVGRGTGVVTATATQTEIGRIGGLVEGTQSLSTPLLQNIDRFARLLSVVIVGAAVMVYLFGRWVHDAAADDLFVAVIALAVAAIPEGLPAIITIALALGVQSMARRRAIVRRLPAVEALGAVTIICTDKTGTLTRGEMMVSAIVTTTRHYVVSGDGYRPTGTIDPLPDDDAGACALLRCATLCNDATVEQGPDGPLISGDPTEAALRVLTQKAGIDSSAMAVRHARTAVIPFESAHRYMATAHGDFALLKGAPEAVFAYCGAAGDEWNARSRALAESGRRVLAFAERAGGALDTNALGDDWRPLGIVGLIDAPRPESVTAVAACHAAGIRVLMVTGDHEATARAIADELGITEVLARASPEQKLRLVERLQGEGEVVAMTGDGVNDAPALKRASVGVAMGIKGTEAARAASEIVLADDNFASIAAAVAEGRRIYDNIRKTIVFILPTSAGEALTIGLAILLGRVLPLTPVQVLWVNMVTAVTLSLAIVFEPAERDIMSRPPRDPREPILSRELVRRTLLVCILMLAAIFGLFEYELAHGASVEYARTVAVNALVLCEVTYLLNSRYLRAALTPTNAFAGNHWILASIVAVLALQVAFTYSAPLQFLFGTTAIDAYAWGRAAAAAIALLIVVELEKWRLRVRDTA